MVLNQTVLVVSDEAVTISSTVDDIKDAVRCTRIRASFLTRTSEQQSNKTHQPVLHVRGGSVELILEPTSVLAVSIAITSRTPTG